MSAAATSVRRTARAPLHSLDDLLARATERTPLKTSDSLSSATFERLVIDGDRYVLKHLHCDDDWVMRATGDVTCRPARMWLSGLADLLPPQIDTVVAGVATGLGRHGWGTAVLMHDVAELLVPEGDGVVPLPQHRRFLAHMAALHARFLGVPFAELCADEPLDALGLASPYNRLFFFNPWLPEIERARGIAGGVPSLTAGGWAALRRINPGLGATVDELFHEPGALLDAFDRTPSTLVHSDWKYGNLGSRPGDDGATILIDWAFPGWGAPGTDLAWYLSVNCRRLPETKDEAIDAYRAELEALGVDTGPWWEEQLGVACIGAFVQLGWSKALEGPDAEYRWWEERVLDATRWLA